jgi:surface carbohydrate biosynthesis protein
MEIKARELEGKSLLAFEVASRGFRVILGNKNHINWGLKSNALPAGIYFDKSLTRGKEDSFKEIIRRGCLIASQDEESGLLDSSYDKFISFRSTFEAVNLASAIFCWGKHDYNSWIEHYPNFRNKIKLTGSPRVDLWRPEFKRYFKKNIFSIKKRFGKFILISSNFAAANDYKNVEERIQQGRKDGSIKSQEDELNMRREIEEDKKMFECFVDLVHYLSEIYKDINFIIRPHPAEKISGWQRKLSNKKNIKIIFEGSINSWLHASMAVLHTGCTTGIEAYVSNIPAISYSPFSSSRNREIPNKLSINCDSKEEVSNIISQIIQKKFVIQKYKSKEKDKIIKNRLLNVDGETATKKIADEIEKIKTPANCGIRMNFKMRKWVTKYKIKNFIIKKIRKNVEHNPKFPYLELDELKKIKENLDYNKENYGNLSIKRLYGDVFVIEKD